ncbi:hypothetical protein GGQ64_005389 [Rhizobium azooxidifex]|uniref:Uncharacterized protein n=1 Tax=Mycoplana azooxidifex TaxID=1636188 RepID=A0A7W6DGE4_9HYPH|nr:hypothetical protein [Mycoplana azooxidifex]
MALDYIVARKSTSKKPGKRDTFNYYFRLYVPPEKMGIEEVRGRTEIWESELAPERPGHAPPLS